MPRRPQRMGPMGQSQTGSAGRVGATLEGLETTYRMEGGRRAILGCFHLWLTPRRAFRSGVVAWWYAG